MGCTLDIKYVHKYPLLSWVIKDRHGFRLPQRSHLRTLKNFVSKKSGKYWIKSVNRKILRSFIFFSCIHAWRSGYKSSKESQAVHTLSCDALFIYDFIRIICGKCSTKKGRTIIWWQSSRRMRKATLLDIVFFYIIIIMSNKRISRTQMFYSCFFVMLLAKSWFLKKFSKKCLLNIFYF